MRGWSFGSKDRLMQTRKYCEKCGSWWHYTWACQKYERYSKYECKVCNKNLHHWDRDCMGDHRDENVPYRRRPESRDRRPPSRDARDPRSGRPNSRDRRSNSTDNRTQRPPSRDRRDRSNSRDNMARRDRNINLNQ